MSDRDIFMSIARIYLFVWDFWSDEYQVGGRHRPDMLLGFYRHLAVLVNRLFHHSNQNFASAYSSVSVGGDLDDSAWVPLATLGHHVLVHD